MSVDLRGIRTSRAACTAPQSQVLVHFRLIPLISFSLIAASRASAVSDAVSGASNIVSQFHRAQHAPRHSQVLVHFRFIRFVSFVYFR
jgi:hypothetical protein